MSELQKALEEFKAQTRNLGLRADSPPATRKRGSVLSKWHGRLYENLRNDIFDAVPHEIRQRGSDKSLLRRNQFGFNVAGPLTIPKLLPNNKAFVSVSYEGVRERISRSYLQTVATDPERLGDFSQTVDLSGQSLPIYDPASTRRNPAFDPNQPVTVDNLEYLRDPFPGNRIPTSRLDAKALSALSLYPHANASVGPFFQNNYVSVSPETNTANGMIFRLDYTLTERHRLDLSGSFSNGLAAPARLFPTEADPNPADRKFTSRRAGLEHTFTASPKTVYTLSLQAATDSTNNESDPFPAYRFTGGYTPMGRANPNTRQASNSLSIDPGLTTRKGRHSLRLAGHGLFRQLNTYAATYPMGTYNFGPGLTSLPGIVNTGYGFASYLLGLADSAGLSVVAEPSYFRRSEFGIAGRDSYEISRSLTVTGGLNLSIATPRIEKYDRQSTIDLNAINPENGRPGALVFAGRNGYGRSFQPVRVRLEPSASVAWNPGNSSKTVVRAGYARSYQAVGLGYGQWGTQGFNASPTFISSNVQLQPAAVLGEGLPMQGVAVPDLRGDAVNGTIADLMDMTSRQPRYQSASFSIQRDVPGGVVITTGFGHADGKNLMVSSASANPNAISLDALQYRDQLNEESFRSQLRPYPQYQGFKLNSMYPLGRYQRDAGYVRLEKRTSGGLGLSAYYEYSKQMDDYSGPYGTQDFYHRENEWAMTAGSTPQVFSLTYTYELPLGPSKPLFSYSDWRRYLVEGWSISGMTSMSSGDPLYLRPQFNNTGGVVSALNVNVVPGVDPRVPDPGPALWFNPAAFDQPADFTIGNASRTHPFLRNPGNQNSDISVTKRFSLDVERAVELSAVGFNFLNHANWNNPDNVIGPASAPNVNAGKIIGSTGGRVLQVGLRYSF